MLRKSSLLALFCLFLPSASLLAGGFTAAGIKLGLNQSTFVGDDIPIQGIHPIPGLAMGGFAVYKLHDFHIAGQPAALSIQQEIALTTLGSSINSVGELQLTNILIYLEFPLLAQVALYPDKPLQPYLFLGPDMMNILLAANDIAMLRDIRDWDCNLVIGAGLKVWKLSLDARWQRGLINFDVSPDELDLKNQSLSFRMGYSF